MACFAGRQLGNAHAVSSVPHQLLSPTPQSNLGRRHTLHRVWQSRGQMGGDHAISCFAEETGFSAIPRSARWSAQQHATTRVFCRVGKPGMLPARACGVDDRPARPPPSCRRLVPSGVNRPTPKPGIFRHPVNYGKVPWLRPLQSRLLCEPLSSPARASTRTPPPVVPELGSCSALWSWSRWRLVWCSPLCSFLGLQQA